MPLDDLLSPGLVSARPDSITKVEYLALRSDDHLGEHANYWGWKMVDMHTPRMHFSAPGPAPIQVCAVCGLRPARRGSRVCSFSCGASLS
jgi:hypothetical protein